jgi:hypothetical protein
MTAAPEGHNSGVSGERLRSIIKRIEKLEENKSFYWPSASAQPAPPSSAAHTKAAIVARPISIFVGCAS